MFKHLLNGLSAVGNVMDLPGSMVRDTLAGQNPFDQLASPLHDTNRTTGRDLLRSYGMAGKKDTWGNFAGGLATEIATDPTNLIGVGLIKKAMQSQRYSRGLRNSVIARNSTNQAGNLASDIARNRASQFAGESADQSRHLLPANLPADRTVDVSQLPEGWRRIPSMSMQEQLRAAYGPRDDAAQILGRYVTGGRIEPTKNFVAKRLTANAPYSTYQFHAPQSGLSAANIDASGVSGFVHKQRPDLMFHRADLHDARVMDTVPHESIHSMASQEPQLYSQLRDAVGDDAINRFGNDLGSAYSYTGLPSADPKFAEEAIATGIGRAIGSEAEEARAPLLKMLNNGDPYGSRLHRVIENIARDVNPIDASTVGSNLVNYMSGASKKARAIVPVSERATKSPPPKSFAVGLKPHIGLVNYRQIRAVPDVPISMTGPFTAGLAGHNVAARSRGGSR